MRAASSGEVLRFRVMAWVAGVSLILLTFVAVPLKYLGDDPRLSHWIGPPHGFLYLAYVVTAFTLAYRLRWSPVRTVLVLLAGTVPFMSFVAERRVVADLRQPARQEADPVSPPA